MKKLLLAIVCLTYLSSISLAQVNLLIDYKTFFLEGDKPYIEFYLSIDGNSIKYQDIGDGFFQGKLETTYIISDENDSIVAFEKFMSLSPKYTVESEFYDIFEIKRFPLENGTYNFEFVVKDLSGKSSGDNKVKLNHIHYNNAEMQFSDVVLCFDIKNEASQGLVKKNGIGLDPNLGYLFKTQDEKLGFYLELYNSKKKLGEQEAFLIEYYVSIADKKTVFNNIRGFARLNSSSAIPVAKLLNIKDLPSGNYDLVIACRNRNNELLIETTKRFQKSNTNLENLEIVDAASSFVSKIDNLEQLKEYVRSTQPIALRKELEFAQNQMKYSNLDLMQKYFLNFWRDRNQLNPEEEWLKYKKEVMVAQEKFGYGGVKGYQTERGRIYLQYGKPNAVQNVPYEPNTYPYSVWQYYKLNGQTNRKFLFYSPSMEMLGYKLLDSNVPGEIQNPNWQAELENKTQNRGNTYELQNGETINDRAKDLYDNPR